MSDTGKGAPAASTSTPADTPPPPPQTSSTLAPPKQPGLLQRAFSKDNRATAKRFFSAYAEAWVGLYPLWLMGEALTPNTKVGTKFRRGRDNLISAAEEVKKAVSANAQDVIVIVDDRLKGKSTDTKAQVEKTAEVLKAAGENAIIVVTSSFAQLQAEATKIQKEYGPEIRKVVTNRGRDVIVILDKALKHPVVITGVTKFAKSRGIPHADAILRLGSLALSKILKAMPEEVQGEVQEHINVEEMDAAELERTSTKEENEEARNIGKQADGEKALKVEEEPMGKNYEIKKRAGCEIM